ncbi:hypothetical protein FACS189434_07060 [Bacteroidia bacterium]|nr:hypothetical protein FACS189434_07060 [Bacteroidia bacterium]
MQKEIGKWFMDIAKYVATAVLISSFLGSFNDKWLVYIIGACIVLLCFFIGLYFINLKKKE